MKQIFPVFLLLILAIGCNEEERPMNTRNEINPIVKELQTKYAPDKRTAIFSVAVTEKKGSVTLKGEVDDPAAKDELMARFGAQSGKVIDSVDVLPSQDLGEKTWGIITVSVANMRSDPKESAELGSQVLMGSIVKVWKKKSGFAYVQSPDHYLGWVDTDQLHRVTKKEAKAWDGAQKIFVKGLLDVVHEQPDENSYPVCDLVGGDVLKRIAAKGPWIAVELADGRKGYVKQSIVIDAAEWGKSLRPVPENIERTGKFLMGVPYLWGGTSVKGVDCSGFTKTVFLLNGVMLNRDANQQADQGVPVEPGTKFANLKKGDLLFFGKKAGGGRPERIVHVGIYLGNQVYIHSSGKVQVSSFDPASPIFNEYNLDRFVRARRVIPDAPKVKEVAVQ
ncbi:MAG: C40 family peptidase [Bacteroidota bacterium]|jgi:hypothetical protein